jgi:hypothetical protein
MPAAVPAVTSVKKPTALTLLMRGRRASAAWKATELGFASQQRCLSLWQQQTDLSPDTHSMTTPVASGGLQHVHAQRLMDGFSERLSSAADAGASLREVDSISPPAEEDFTAMRTHLRRVFSEYVLRNLPVLLKGGVGHWPCTTRWTDQYMTSNVGHCQLRVRAPSRLLPVG